MSSSLFLHKRIGYHTASISFNDSTPLQFPSGFVFAISNIVDDDDDYEEFHRFDLNFAEWWWWWWCKGYT